MKVHPTAPDGTLLEGAYTAEYVQAHFVAKEDVREKYVPKDDFKKRLDAKTSQIAELNTQISGLKDTLIAAQAQTTEADALREKLAAMDAQIAARDDRDAFSKVGLLGESGEADATTVDLLRHLHGKVVEGMEEKPEGFSAAAHFREWLSAEDGARTTPLGHLIKGPQAAPAPEAPAPEPVRAPVAAPTASRGVQAAPPPVMTEGQRRAALDAQIGAWKAEGKSSGEISQLLKAELHRVRSERTPEA